MFNQTAKSKQGRKITFEEEQNIALTKQTYTKDLLEISNSNWAYLYQIMKQRGLNQKQLKKNISKYQENIINLIRDSNINYSKVIMPKQSMRQKIIHYNEQLKIRMSEVFEFVNLLHMEQLQEVFEYLFNALIETIQKISESIEEIKQSNFQIHKEFQDWKLCKTNVLCYNCKKNVQEIKLKNLAENISLTISQNSPSSSFIDQQNKAKSISTQCRNLEIELNAMSEEHFFNSESDSLVELINKVLKAPLNLLEKQEKKENTVAILNMCLSDITDLVKPIEIDYVPIECQRDFKSLKRIDSLINPMFQSSDDFLYPQEFRDKLNVMIAQPLHRFVNKYFQIIESKYSKVVQTKKIEFKDQQSQTSLVKHPEALKNLEKQQSALIKQLNILKASKEKTQNQLLTALDSLSKKQTKIIEVTFSLKMVEKQNQNLQNQLRLIKKQCKDIKIQLQAEKQSIISQYSSEKAVLNREILSIQDELKKLNQQNLERVLKLKFQSKQVQTYTRSFNSFKQLCENQTQTDELCVVADTTKLTKKNQLFTFHLNSKLKLNSLNQDVNSKALLQNLQNKNSKALPQNVMNKKTFHLKNKQQIIDGNQFISQKNSLKTSRHDLKVNSSILADQNIKLSPGPFDDGTKNRIKNEKNFKREADVKKSRKPSINVMIPSIKKLTSNLTINSLTQQQLDKKMIEMNSPLLECQDIFGLKIHKHTQSNVDYHDGKENLRDTRCFIETKSIVSITKLKKNPKQQKNLPNKKRVVISSNRNSQVKIQNQSHSVSQQVSQQVSKQIQQKFYEKSFICQTKETGMQTGEQKIIFFDKIELQKNQDFLLDEQKELVARIVAQNYSYFKTIGLINFIKKVNFEKYQNNLSQQSNGVVQNYQNQNKIHLCQMRIHIRRTDLELFFSLEEALKYENKRGLWGQIESFIMVGTNFSNITDGIQSYFQYLKISRKEVFCEYFLFLSTPFKFIQQIFDQNNINTQKQRIAKEIIKLKKINTKRKTTIFIKQVFQKLIKLHSLVHKNNCCHVQNFLQKIGFYEYQSRNKLSRKQVHQVKTPNKIIKRMAMTATARFGMK